jgi:uncharacterized membrane protein YfcA
VVRSSGEGRAFEDEFLSLASLAVGDGDACSGIRSTGFSLQCFSGLVYRVTFRYAIDGSYSRKSVFRRAGAGSDLEDLAIWEVLLVAGVIGAATAIQGVAGFGFMLLGMIGLIQVYPPQIVVPVLTVVYIPLGIAQTIQLRREVDLKLLRAWLAGAVVGVVPGTLALTIVDPVTLKRAIGLATIALTVAIRFNPGQPFRRDTLARLIAGLAGGLTAGVSAAAGPPIVLVGLKQQWPVESFRATLFCFFLIISCVLACVQTSLNLITPLTFQLALSGVPGIVGGFLLAGAVRGKISAEAVRSLGTGLMLVGGLVALVL